MITITIKKDLFIQSFNGFSLILKKAKIRLKNINITEIAGAENSKKIPILKHKNPKLELFNLPKNFWIFFIKYLG
jgi:hypothetical protein